MDEGNGVVGTVVAMGMELGALLSTFEGALQRPGATCPGHSRDVLDGVIDFVQQANEALAGAIGLMEGLVTEMQERDDAGAV